MTRRRARAALTLAALFVAALIIGGTSAVAAIQPPAHLISHTTTPQASKKIHGVCTNPDTSDHRSDLLIWCAELYPHVPPPPKLPTLTAEFKVKTNHTPQFILLVVKLYKWPAHGDHAHLYERCIRPGGGGGFIPCDHSWTTKDFPAPGDSDLFEFRMECQPGRYYFLFRFHGITSGGQPEDGHWFDPHPSNKTDQTAPNRQESIFIHPGKC